MRSLIADEWGTSAALPATRSAPPNIQHPTHRKERDEWATHGYWVGWEESRQRQERNTGVSPLRFAPVEMTTLGWMGEERATARETQIPCGNDNQKSNVKNRSRSSARMTSQDAKAKALPQ